MVRVMLLGAPLLLTAACHSDFGPFPMPTGYKYHDKIYKTPPGPEPVFKKIDHMGVPQSTEKQCEDDQKKMSMAPVMDNADMMMSVPAGGSWDYAAADLVRRITDQFGRPTEPVYVQPAATNQELGLEKALRMALTDQGLNLAPAPGVGPYALHYSAKGMGTTGRAMVTVTLMGQDGPLIEQSGMYDLGADAPVATTIPASAPVLAPPPEPAEPGAPMPILPVE
ncbi:MAG: hypothetical protein H6867_01665 [Rhodospirillales bacterium]|nr:hypothetical protein [Rhodospirillales bacterium]